MPHEQVLSTIFFGIAFCQLVFMSVQPTTYSHYRHAITLTNRMLRMLVVVLSAILLTPAQARRQVEVWLRTDSAPQAHGSHNHTITPASADGVDDVSVTALLKAFVGIPLIYLSHANFLVSFRLAVVLQLITAGATISMDVQRLCASLMYAQASAAAIVPACKGLSSFMYGASQLLDWHFSTDPVGQVQAASAVVCADPLVALLLMKLWVHVILLVLAPCTLIYSLEWQMKSRFLISRAAAQATAASVQQDATASGQPAVAHPSSQPSASTRPHSAVHGEREQQQRSRQHRLQQVLDGVSPVSVGQALAPVRGASCAGLAVLAGLLLCAVLVCWYSCELYLTILLGSGRRLVCDAEGWLHLV